MRSLFVAAVVLQDFLKKQGWRFCYIGGIAVQRWGENRVTRDLDLTVFTQLVDDERFVKEALTFLKPRRADAFEFALNSRVLLAEMPDGTPVDLALGFLPFEEEMIKESSEFQFLDDVTLRTCSAESLLVLKAFANRPRDWEDIRGILVKQGKKINQSLVEERLRPLVDLKEEPEIVAKFQELVTKVVH